MMDGLLGGAGMNLPLGRRYPPVNIWEDDPALHFEAEIPGLALEDLEVEVLGQELTIRGRRHTPDTSGVHFHRQERATGDFVRTFELPVEVDAENAQADLKEGLLRVTLPKAECSRAKKIEIHPK
jgi:HSP20 family protein